MILLPDRYLPALLGGVGCLLGASFALSLRASRSRAAEGRLRLRRTCAFLWAYPQIAGLIILGVPLVPLPALFVFPAAVAMSRSLWLGFFYPPVALGLILASALLGALFGLGALALGLSRLRGERPGWVDGWRMLSRRSPEFGAFVLRLLDKGPSSLDPLLLPALLHEDASFDETLIRVARFRAEQVRAAAAVDAAFAAIAEPAKWLLMIGLPFTIGFLALPLVSVLGWDLPPLESFGIYRPAAWLTAICTGLVAGGLGLAAAVAEAFTAAAYLGAAGPGRVKEAVLRAFDAELLAMDPAPAAERPAPKAAGAPAAPSPAKAPEPAATAPEPAQPPEPEEPEPALEPELPPAPFPASAPAMPAPGEGGAGGTEWEREAQSIREAISEMRRQRAEPPQTPAPPPPKAPKKLAFALAMTLTVLATASLWLLRGPGIAWRSYVCVNGWPAEGLVERVGAVRDLTGERGSVIVRYTHGQGELARVELPVGPAGVGSLRRGTRVEVRYDPRRPQAGVLLEDFGFSRRRAMLLVLLAALFSIAIGSLLRLST